MVAKSALESTFHSPAARSNKKRWERGTASPLGEDQNMGWGAGMRIPHMLLHARVNPLAAGLASEDSSTGIASSSSLAVSFEGGGRKAHRQNVQERMRGGE